MKIPAVILALAATASNIYASALPKIHSNPEPLLLRHDLKPSNPEFRPENTTSPYDSNGEFVPLSAVITPTLAPFHTTMTVSRSNGFSALVPSNTNPTTTLRPVNSTTAAAPPDMPTTLASAFSTLAPSGTTTTLSTTIAFTTVSPSTPSGTFAQSNTITTTTTTPLPQNTLQLAIAQFYSDTSCENSLGTKSLTLVPSINTIDAAGAIDTGSIITKRTVLFGATIEGAQSCQFDDTGDAEGWAVLQTGVPDGDGFNETNPLLQSCVTFDGLGGIYAEAWVN
ncbi:MAG: hypothetical protein MMC33_009363 [Icmadophila ericetorum]|nr:hypothetical protein [Icmadophila ericetorum]